MLYFLVIFMVFINPSFVHAEEMDMFFNSGISFFDGKKEIQRDVPDKCTSCSKKEELSSFDNSVITKNLYEKKSFNNNNRVVLFVTPECKLSTDAIKKVIGFNNTYQEWEIDIFIVASLKSFNSFIYENKKWLDKGVAFHYDFGLFHNDKYKITEYPAYIITKGNGVYKVSGQPVLDQIIGNL